MSENMQPYSSSADLQIWNCYDLSRSLRYFEHMDSLKPEICLEIQSSETDLINETQHPPKLSRKIQKTNNSSDVNFWC